MKIQVHCDDGSDENCQDTVEIELPYPELTELNIQVSWVIERGRNVVKSVQIVPPDAKWVKRHANSLHPSEIEAVSKDGVIYLEYSDLKHGVCDACGSDQTYDPKGNNTSHN